MKENIPPHPNLPLMRPEESFLHKSALLILPPDAGLGAREDRMIPNETIPKNSALQSHTMISREPVRLWDFCWTPFTQAVQISQGPLQPGP